MTEEEKKAIEDLKDFKSITILYGNTFVMFLEQLIKYQESTNIVLNLITKLEKENEKERNKNKQLSNSIIKIYKEQDNLQARLDRKRDEIREKDKQIKDLQLRKDSNVLSELEKYKKAYELETWKKIAEKLAYKWAETIMYYDKDRYQNHDLVKTKAEKYLNWVRKEVENET